MANHKHSAEEIQEMKARSAEWREFMKQYKFTETMLADVLGYSRRSVQMVRAARMIPNKVIQNKFNILKRKYERDAKKVA